MIFVTVDAANITAKDEAILALARHVGDAGLRALGIDLVIQALTWTVCEDGHIFDRYVWPGHVAFASAPGGITIAAVYGTTFDGTVAAWHPESPGSPP